MPYIFSKLAADMQYVVWKEPDDKNAKTRRFPERKILVKGGAGVASKHLVTPEGIVTEVTDEELALLEAHSLFQLHKKNGFIKVENKEVKIDKAVRDMEERDFSAPKRPKDFKKAPETGAPKKLEDE